MKITVKNPSREIIEQSVADVKSQYENELNRTLKRALDFLNGDKQGKKVFRSKPVVVTIEKL